jgi:Mg-chelatase subunit ChlI
MQALFVDTDDSARIMWLASTLTRHKSPVLITGAKGTGKTVCIQRLLSLLENDAFVSIPMTFSAQTNANQVQVSHGMLQDCRDHREFLFGFLVLPTRHFLHLFLLIENRNQLFKFLKHS